MTNRVRKYKSFFYDPRTILPTLLLFPQETIYATNL